VSSHRQGGPTAHGSLFSRLASAENFISTSVVGATSTEKHARRFQSPYELAELQADVPWTARSGRSATQRRRLGTIGGRRWPLSPGLPTLPTASLPWMTRWLPVRIFQTEPRAFRPLGSVDRSPTRPRIDATGDLRLGGFEVANAPFDAKAVPPR